MTENAYGVKVGDIFYESWGYDQTNVDFHQVTKTTKKMVEITRIAGKTVGDGHKTRLVPDVGNFISDKPRKKLVQQYLNEWRGMVVPREPVTETFLHMTSYSNAYLTDPETSHFDTIAAGYPGH